VGVQLRFGQRLAKREPSLEIVLVHVPCCLLAGSQRRFISARVPLIHEICIQRRNASYRNRKPATSFDPSQIKALASAFMERPKAGGRAQGGRRGASLLEAARSGRVLRSLANTASAAAAENNLNSGTRAAKKRLSESPACSDAFVRRVLPRLPRGEQAPAGA